MSAERSTVVLVHGAWGGAWCWERLVPLLEQGGLAVRTVNLPSVAAEPDPAADLAGDAAAVRAVLDDAGGPILLVGHSYGGMVVTEAATGHPGVSRLLYLCAFMPEQGQSLFDITGGPAPWIEAKDDGTVLPFADQAADTFFGDCDPETQRWASAQLRPMRPPPFLQAVASAAWEKIPSTYVVCAQDRALPPELQRDLFAPRASEVVELETSHSPFFSEPEVLADLIAERAARRGS